ncbi:TPA: hypothetical protein N0F65_004434 [Lagenidium giganteum]|uniref:Uncharacterized protein n=1 Tax=Lagenidium giganteum TaxID=4803 RepID=A0AAV2ZJ55_9STRA|nr:TPA: hypothetical protein N0F65_004434 [Lagenidium giganteum]
MSIFGGSERFPDEPARSPGPIYGRAEVRPRGQVVVMKEDYKPVDEDRKWGKRESWIGSHSPQMPVVPKDSNLAPGRYNQDNINAVKNKAPKVSFPKSTRFISQRVNVTDKSHQRELMATDSPGPKYNVDSLTSNGGKSGAPRFSFAPPSPGSKTRLPSVETPQRGHRESWLSVINRNGVLIMPGSPRPVRSAPRDESAPQPHPPPLKGQGQKATEVRATESANQTPPGKSPARPRDNRIGSVFGNEHRFGMRQERVKAPRQSVGGTRVQLISERHTRENMGEFSPGPIYNPFNPDTPGGRLAPSPRSGRRNPPPGSPVEQKNPHANLNSRSSWLAGNVRKNDGLETVLMRTGDIPPGPGSYAEAPSSFRTFSHNVKTKAGAQVMAPGTTKESVAVAAPAPDANNAATGCTSCGREVADSDAFCIYCGTKVVRAPAPPQKPKAAEPAPEAPSPPKKDKASAASPLEGKQAAPTPAPTSSSAASTAPSSAPSSSNGAPEAKAASAHPAPVISGNHRGPKTPRTAAGSTGSSHSAPTQPQQTAAQQNLGRAQSDGRLLQQQQARPASRTRGSLPEDAGRGSLDGMAEVSGLDKLWVPDSFSSECMDCHATFGFPKPRRHHCRVCGLLFCRACVQNKVQIPSSFGYGNAPQRCCRSCVSALKLKSITSPADIFAQRKGHKRSFLANKSHYELLGLTREASQDEITRRYQEVSRTMDPTSKADMDKLDRINDAYRTLQDPDARHRHDSDLHMRDSSLCESDRVIPTETARSDQTECQVCFRPFKLGRRQHHCRRCTRSVCNNCSEGTKPIPELGFPTPVRHCSACMDSPPKFIYPVMDPVAKPPAGFEYLSKLDIRVAVKSASAQDDELFIVKTYCEPNDAAVQNVKYALTDADRTVANEYCLSQKRSYNDFEWLFGALGEVTNIKALPFFPERRLIKGERERGPLSLQMFLFGAMLHPLLRDAHCLKAFLALTPDEFSKYRRTGVKKPLYDNEKYNGLVTTLRLEFEKAQMRAKIDELSARQRAHTQRMELQRDRIAKQKTRESNQNVRREQAMTRFKALEARKESQTERMEREKDRYIQQSSTTHILFFDTIKDESVRKTEEETRQKEKVEFTKSKDSFQADTTQWNADMAQWSKHRGDWSEDHNPPVSKDIANEWILKSYGVYHSHTDNVDNVPRELVELHAQMIKMQEKEPVFLEEEGNAVDEEWMKLAKEREHWTSDRANMKREDEMCADEDVRYEQEHEYVRQAAEARQKKKLAIETDLKTLKAEIINRGRCIAQRRTRHEALHEEFETEWRVKQADRSGNTKNRLEEHDNRLGRGKKRCEIFQDQLARQTQSQRMLLFKRAALTEERKNDVKLFDEHKEDCKATLEECHNARLITPEYVARLEADMKVRAEELQMVLDSNKRTPSEGGDAEVDERDEFMNEVRRRRQAFQKELNEQKEQLQVENDLCTSLLKRMQEHIQKLDEEIENAAKENALIVEFQSLQDSELKLLADEEKKREEKKALITDLMNSAGNWVLDALHEHSKRKKKEADRLVKQAVRAADLQKLVQHFTHRVIEQEERIMRQKQRILNGEHKVEMLKSSENWYQYVTGYTPDLGLKDMKVLDSGRKERIEDLKEASRLQKDDENDKKSVGKEAAISRKFATDKEEKREIWAQIEDVYSLTKPQEKDEDMMMTSQIRSLLQQLGEAFEMLTNRLLEEDESLTHAATQLEGEVESINSFMERMESEESALCATEKTSLAKESQVRRTESDLIEQRARALIDNYKQMQSEHVKYQTELNNIKSRRNEREKPVLPREAEIESARRLIKSRNYYDRKACAEFAKRFRVENYELKEVRDVFEWLKVVQDRDVRRMERWLEASRKERKQIEVVKIKGSEIDWEKDTLARIPALKEIQRKLMNKAVNGGERRGSTEDGAIHPTDQWIVELIQLKATISDVDARLLKDISATVESILEEEQTVQNNLQKMKKDKEYVLNSIRFIDQEEARAVRGLLHTRRSANESENGSFVRSSGSAAEEREVAPSRSPSPSLSNSFNKNKAPPAPSPKPAKAAPSPSPKPAKAAHAPSPKPAKAAPEPSPKPAMAAPPAPAQRAPSPSPPKPSAAPSEPPKNTRFVKPASALIFSQSRAVWADGASIPDQALSCWAHTSHEAGIDIVIAIAIALKMSNYGWIAPVVIVGVCVLSFLWTVVTAPGFKVQNKHVLITGATKGLGLAIAKKYAKAGAKLTLVGRSMERLEQARSAIDAVVPGASIYVHVCDITKLEQVEHAVAAANEHHDAVTEHVVCAAAIATPGYFLDQDRAIHRRAVDVNYFGTLHVLKAAVPAMVENNVHGHCVLVSSVVGLAASVGASSFSGSKGALRGLAEALRNEFLQYDIRISIFYPGSFSANVALDEPVASDSAPQTPLPNSEPVHTSYSTFTNQNNADTVQHDHVAQQLVNGVSAGYFAITNSWNGYLMRILCNGIAPRKNTPLEFMLLPLIVLRQLIVTAYYDNHIAKVSSHVAASHGTAA